MNDRILYERCPICDSDRMDNLVVGDCSKHPLYVASISSSIPWKKCSACQHIFTAGYYTKEAAGQVFSSTNASQQVGAQVEKNRLVSSRIVEKVLPYQAEGVWLDVGFGNGSLLFTAKEYGFKPIGIDLRENSVRQMASLGIETHQIDITELNLGGKCSVISMADVLEHMPFPRRGLAAANRNMFNGGALFLSMPNTESILWELMDKQNSNPYWGELEHYHNFSRTGLYRLLNDHGFKPVRFGVSERYRACMEVIGIKTFDLAN